MSHEWVSVSFDFDSQRQNEWGRLRALQSQISEALKSSNAGMLNGGGSDLGPPPRKYDLDLVGPNAYQMVATIEPVLRASPFLAERGYCVSMSIYNVEEDEDEAEQNTEADNA